jgi:hypothetical protein
MCEPAAEIKQFTMKNRIIVVDRGGLVQTIYAGDPDTFDIDVLDYDNMAEESDSDELQHMKHMHEKTDNMTAIY